MLRPEMVAELNYFFAMIMYGVLVAVCYHLLLYIRAVIRHGTSFVDAEDILFFIGAGFLFFLVAYRMNYGVLRWYAFAGAGAGACLYVRTLARPLECVRKWLLQKREKTFKIKPKFSSKGQVSVVEGSSPEYKKKRKKKERT